MWLWWLVCLLEGTFLTQAFMTPLSPPSREGSTLLEAKRGGTKAPHKCLEIECLEESDYWKLEPALDILRAGGLGVIPVDSCYVFACDIHSRGGVEKIFTLKKFAAQKKPLSLLCNSISTINQYTGGVDKSLFKRLKKALPGPYTLILPATHEVPRVLLQHKAHKKTWKRREIGVRMPDQPICLKILQGLESPLLCSSVPHANASDEDEGEDDHTPVRDPVELLTWKKNPKVDFIVDAGVVEPQPGFTSIGFSTVVDFMGPEPLVIREGLGDPSFLVE
ncbi:unnamed protein product [Chrysoparadoxa australica]